MARKSGTIISKLSGFKLANLLLALSLLFNAVFLAFVLFIASPGSDLGVLSYGLGRTCGTDYDKVVSGISNQRDKDAFTQLACQRDPESGAQLEYDYNEQTRQFTAKPLAGSQ